MSTYIKKLLQLLILSFISLAALSVPAGVVDTKHNLAHWSPYQTFAAVSESRVCIFCHTPHNSSPDGPLWSHKLTDSGVTFKKYSSATLRILGAAQASSEYKSSGVSGDATTITGATKLCLGCHDGLTALGAITTGAGSFIIETNVATLSGEESGYDDAGTVNIQSKHPVSFKYDAAVITALNGAVTPPAVKTNYYNLPKNSTNNTTENLAVQKMVDAAGGRIECTVCHDPHENKATNNRDLLPFWVSGAYIDAGSGTLGNFSSYEGVCASCHSTSFGEYTFFGDYTTLR